jgi:hypothetical protein
MNLQKLHVQSKLWKRHNRNAQGWTLYCVNDVKNVEMGQGNLQIMIINEKKNYHFVTIVCN